MATVYILYSSKLQKYYVGSCEDLSKRIEQHRSGFFAGGFTTTANDWEIVFHLDNLSYTQARKIETHIKKMKSKKYIENLKKHSEIAQNLIALYK